tara:strand:+ start:8047 stop:9147 length:1101 start_codon:yes stop_codon:yes gene_type:complete
MDTSSKLDLIRQSMAGELGKPVYEAIQEISAQEQSPETAAPSEQSSVASPAPSAPPASPSFSTTIYDNKGEMVTPSTSGVGLNQTIGSKSGSMIQPGEYRDGGLKYEEGGPKKKLKKGTNIKQLQNFLIKKGYDLGAGEGKAITKGIGSFGPQTKAALAAYNKTQSFDTLRAQMPSPTDIIPTNVKEFLKSTVLPSWAYNMLGDLDEENLTLRQRAKLTQTVDEALKENKSQLGYKDNSNMKAYDEFGYSDMGNTSEFFDVAKKSLTSPAYNLKTTIGRANIIETPEYYDDEGNVVASQRFVSDEYDFNDSQEAADRTFTEKWTDILGAKSFQAGMRAVGRNYGNTKPKNTMIRVQEKGGLRKKKK